MEVFGTAIGTVDSSGFLEVEAGGTVIDSGTISEREFKLLKFADTVDDAFDQIRTDLERYHLPLDKFI